MIRYIFVILLFLKSYSNNIENQIKCLLEENKHLEECLIKKKVKESKPKDIKIIKKFALGLTYQNFNSEIALSSKGLFFQESNRYGNQYMRLSRLNLKNEFYQTSNQSIYKSIYNKRKIKMDSYKIEFGQNINLKKISKIYLMANIGISWRKSEIYYDKNFEGLKIKGESFFDEFIKEESIELNLGLNLSYRISSSLAFAFGISTYFPITQLNQSFSKLSQNDQKKIEEISQLIMNKQLNSYSVHLSYLF